MYCVNSGKLCPDGWHVASDAEWAALTAFLGNTSIAGGKLKGNGAQRYLKHLQHGYS